MRCKPGSLAVFTNPPPALADHLLGVVVTTVCIDRMHGVDSWRLDRTLSFPGERGDLDHAMDSWLRPIDADPEITDVPAEDYAHG